MIYTNLASREKKSMHTVYLSASRLLATDVGQTSTMHL